MRSLKFSLIWTIRYLKLKKRLRKARQFKQGMMQQWLTGKIRLILVAIFAIFRFFGVSDDLLKSFFRVDTLPIATSRPDGTIDESRMGSTQAACGIGFELIANDTPCVTGRGEHDVNMIRACVSGPVLPRSMIAVFLNLSFDDRLMLLV